VTFARQCPDPPLRLFARHALACDQSNAAFHLALVQRVLAPVEFSFWFFDPATPIRTGAEGNQEHGSLPLSFYMVGILGTAVVLSQFYNVLVSGVFWLFYAAVIFPLPLALCNLL
jgi:hypothetical protein